MKFHTRYSTKNLVLSNGIIWFRLYTRRFLSYSHVQSKNILKIFCNFFLVTLANVIPFLGLFIALIGATCGAFLALILPALLELVAIYDDLSKLTVAKDVIIMLTGIVGMFTGTVLTIMDIVDAFKKKHS